MLSHRYAWKWYGSHGMREKEEEEEEANVAF